MMNIEDDEEPDPEYGVFGDTNPRPIPQLSEREKAEMKRWAKKREQQTRVSREFNSYMIDLYNEARKNER